MPFSIKKLFLKTIGRWIPSDFFAYRFPVSVKGLFFIDNKVILLKNERGVWDLPGGKLNKNESFEICLKREIKEELNIEVAVENCLNAFNIRVANKINVAVLVYFCTTEAKSVQLQISGESFGLKLVDEQELEMLKLPENYRVLIHQAMKKINPDTSFVTPSN